MRYSFLQFPRFYFSLTLLIFNLSLVGLLAGCTAPMISVSSALPISDSVIYSEMPANRLNLLGHQNLVASPSQAPILTIEAIVVAMLFVATLVGIIARQVRLPYTVGLVIIGLLLALLPQVDIKVPPDLIMGLLIPPLIFEAAFHLNFDDLRHNLVPIAAFAIPGVVVTTLLVGGVVSYAAGLSLPLAFVFGALVAATDPISVIALFRTVGVVKRLQVLLEGESLFNDGTSIVLYGLIITIVLTGDFSLAQSVMDFIRISGGGLVVGLVLGILVSQLISRIDDYLIETTLTSVLAFGSYLIAEAFGVSGVLAVVAAGLVNGNIGPHGMSPTTRIVVFNFWEYAGFIANSFAFLLIGLQIKIPVLLYYWQPILIAILAVLVARAVVVYGLSWIGKDIPIRWQHTLFWGGLRGAISLALALSLPLELGTARTQIQVMAFGVVLFTLLVQGFSMRPLMRLLGLTPRSEIQEEYERRHARAVAVQSAYDHLKRMKQRGLISDHIWQRLSPGLQDHSKALVEAVREVMSANPMVEEKELETAHRESLRAQRSTLNDLLNDGVISESTYSQLVTEVDTALAELHLTLPSQSHPPGRKSTKINRLMAAVIQEQDLENSLSALTKLGLFVTRLPSTGGFLGRRNVTLLVGFSAGQEELAVDALNKSCRRRVEYVASPLEGTTLPLPPPIPISIGGATIFTFEVEQYIEF